MSTITHYGRYTPPKNVALASEWSKEMSTQLHSIETVAGVLTVLLEGVEAGDDVELSSVSAAFEDACRTVARARNWLALHPAPVRRLGVYMSGFLEETGARIARNGQRLAQLR